MFARRGVVTRYSRQQTLQWLGWLANALSQQAQAVFYLERLQPDWLPTRERAWYTLVDRLGGALVIGAGLGVLGALLFALILGVMLSVLAGWGAEAYPKVGWPEGADLIVAARGIGLSALSPGVLFGAVVGGLFGGRGEEPGGLRGRLWWRSRSAILGGLVTGTVFWLLLWQPGSGFSWAAGGGLLGAIIGALAGGPSLQPRRISVVGTVRWLPWRALPSGAFGAALGAAVALIGGEAKALSQSDTRVAGLAITLMFALIGGLLGAVVGGLVGGEVEAKVRPNQGIRRSARRALLAGSVVVLGGGAIGALAVCLVVAILLGRAFAAGTSGAVDTPDAPLPMLQAIGAMLGLGAIVGLVAGVLVGPAAALVLGGYACLSHAALRLVLWRRGMIRVAQPRHDHPVASCSDCIEHRLTGPVRKCAGKLPWRGPVR